MLRYENDRFLDDVTIDELSKELNVELVVVKNSGEDFVGAVTGIN